MDAATMWWLLVVFFLCFFLVVDSKSLAAVWTILVHDLSVFHCDVEYIGFGNAVFGVFFSGAGAST